MRWRNAVWNGRGWEMYVQCTYIRVCLMILTLLRPEFNVLAELTEFAACSLPDRSGALGCCPCAGCPLRAWNTAVSPVSLTPGPTAWSCGRSSAAAGSPTTATPTRRWVQAERESERENEERQTDRQRHRHRETQRHRDRDKESPRETETERVPERDTADAEIKVPSSPPNPPLLQRHWQRQRDKERGRDRERQRHRDRDRQRHRHRDRVPQRDTADAEINKSPRSHLHPSSVENPEVTNVLPLKSPL